MLPLSWPAAAPQLAGSLLLVMLSGLKHFFLPYSTHYGHYRRVDFQSSAGWQPSLPTLTYSPSYASRVYYYPGTSYATPFYGSSSVYGRASLGGDFYTGTSQPTHWAPVQLDRPGMATWQNCLQYPTSHQRLACHRFIVSQYEMYQLYLNQLQPAQSSPPAVSEDFKASLYLQPATEDLSESSIISEGDTTLSATAATSYVEPSMRILEPASLVSETDPAFLSNEIKVISYLEPSKDDWSTPIVAVESWSPGTSLSPVAENQWPEVFRDSLVAPETGGRSLQVTENWMPETGSVSLVTANQLPETSRVSLEAENRLLATGRVSLIAENQLPDSGKVSLEAENLLPTAGRANLEAKNQLPYTGMVSLEAENHSQPSSPITEKRQPAWQGKIENVAYTRCHDGKLLLFRSRCNEIIECSEGEDEVDCDWHTRSSITTLHSVLDLEDILRTKENVLGEFFTPWCPACVSFLPHLEQIQRMTQDTPLRMIKMNLDENPGLSVKYNITTLPRIMLWTRGNEVPRMYEKSWGLTAESVYSWILAQIS